MRLGDLFGARSVASPHHRKIQSRGDVAEIVVLVLRLGSVGLLTGVGWLHLHLWQIGYQNIPTIGPLFLAATIGALGIAAALLVRPSRLIGLLGIGTLLGIFGGLIVSVNVGLFGFTESLKSPFAIESIVFELVGAVSLAAWVGLDLLQGSRDKRRVLQGSQAPLCVGENEVRTFTRRLHAKVES